LGDLIPFLDPRLAVIQAGATLLTGLTGNLDFPRNDAAATAVWETENSANDETSPTFDKISMSPNRLGAFTDISKQLLVQSSIDVENFVRNRLSEAVNRALDYALINGDNSTQPFFGILNTTGIGSVAIGTDGGPLTYKHIIDLETALATDNADFGTLAYLTTPGVRGFLKNTEKASGTAQFVWNDGAPPVGQQGVRTDLLNGYRAYVSTQVPSDLTKGGGTNLHSVIFGNFAELLIGQWAGLDVVVDPYSSSKNALVTIVVNSWWDSAVRHAKSFAAIKDADITGI
jgi:HK97 family phage major capsid protein